MRFFAFYKEGRSSPLIFGLIQSKIGKYLHLYQQFCFLPNAFVETKLRAHYRHVTEPTAE